MNSSTPIRTYGNPSQRRRGGYDAPKCGWAFHCCGVLTAFAGLFLFFVILFGGFVQWT